ncbi:MAG TPA: C1 family peptidase [Chthoniobacterales bacterium]|nr:C1 family peptidase [Chthoniobacterales bacterium]
MKKYEACLLLAAVTVWLGTSADTTAQIPASYDLRSVTTANGAQAWVPAIQDQEQIGDCWTFSTATAIDSALLKSGLLPTSVTPPTIAVSSWHLSAANGASEWLTYHDGAFQQPVTDNYGWGGNFYQSLGYVTRGQGQWDVPYIPASLDGETLTTMGGGVVLDSAMPGNAFPTEFMTNPKNGDSLVTPVNYLPVVNQPIAFQTRNVTMYDQGFSSNVPLPTPVAGHPNEYVFDQGAADPQVAVVKAAITSHGAVTTYMNAADFSDFTFVADAGTGKSTVNYFNPSLNPQNSDHAVTIIGWDDNYQMTDPKTNVTTTGAWLVQNSWGTTNVAFGGNSGHNDGTFWASYNDSVIGREGITSFTMGTTSNYSSKVLQNELGPLDYANYYAAGNNPLGMATVSQKDANGNFTAASVFSLDSTVNLMALGLVSQVGGVSATVQFYTGWSSGSGPTGLMSDYSQTVTFGGVGYQLFDLNNPILNYTGAELVVVITYLMVGLDGSLTPVPVVMGESGLFDGDDVPHGLSFFEDGSTWKDLADTNYASSYSDYPTLHGGVLFLKGLQAVPEPSVVLLILAGGALLMIRRSTRLMR